MGLDSVWFRGQVLEEDFPLCLLPGLVFEFWDMDLTFLPGSLFIIFMYFMHSSNGNSLKIDLYYRFLFFVLSDVP